MNLEEYFKQQTAIDHSVRHTVHASGAVSFYIHPQGVDGDTLDYQVRGNKLDPLNGQPDLNRPAALAIPEDAYTRFIGTKVIEARPNRERGGYDVRYPDGYESWSPAAPFEEAYRPLNCMTFGMALEMLKKGHKVARAGWNGKGMWIVLMPALSLPPFSSQAPGAKVNDRTAKHIGADTPLNSQPYIAMWTAQGTWQPGWLASQADMLGEDWMVVE